MLAVRRYDERRAVSAQSVGLFEISGLLVTSVEENFPEGKPDKNP
jgi:hypothetical protein